MAYTSKIFLHHFTTIMLVLVTITLVSMSFSTHNDLAEGLWEVLRSLEHLELDELLLSMFIGLIAALILAFMQISSLTKQIEQLKNSKSAALPADGHSGNRVSYVAKCAVCSKYRLGDDQWLEDDKYISQQLHTKIISGVCPDCGDKHR